MRAKNALAGTLPLPKELKSNKVEDIQEYLTWLQGQLDRQWRLLWQDVNTLQVPIGEFIYFGGKETDGSWRLGRSGADHILQHRDSGVWTTVELSSGS